MDSAYGVCEVATIKALVTINRQLRRLAMERHVYISVY